jgi:opacity protein-like surface antigen
VVHLGLLQSVDIGGGVGYYLGGGWRLDATVEKRSNDQAYISGTDTWESHSYYDDPLNPTVGDDTYGTDPSGNGDFNGDGSVADRLTTIHITDRIDVDGTVWMANMYYDMATYRGFTPYVGAGLGFVWNQLDREHTTTITSCSVEPACPATQEVHSISESNSADTISFAAAAMAGFSYDITEITAVDVGYRYLYLGGTDFAMSIDGVESRVEIGDQHVHQVRAGLRFNVN